MTLIRTHARKLLLLVALLIIAGCASMASRVGDTLYHCLTDCSVDSARQKAPLRIATLNTLHGYPSFTNLGPRFDAIGEELNRLDLDIIFLQEIPWKKPIGLAAEKLKDSTQMNYVYIRANGNYSLIRFEEGLAILSRFPLRDPRFTEVFPQTSTFEHRAALAVVAETPYGPVNLITTHLSYRKDKQQEETQVSNLLAFIDTLPPYPSILGGDFNSYENSGYIKTIEYGWIDVFRQMNANEPGETCCLSSKRLSNTQDGNFFYRADYIFLKKSPLTEWDLLSAELIFDKPFELNGQTQWLTNHRGIVTELKINQSTLNTF